MTITSLYEAAMLREYETPHTPAMPKGCSVCLSSGEGVELMLCVDAEHTVLSASYTTESGDPATLGTLNAFCRLLEGLPLSEAAWHGAAMLEACLRDSNFSHPVKGIIAVENTLPIFQTLQALVRNIWEEYRQTHENAANMAYVPQKSRVWMDNDEDEKMALVEHLLGDFFAAKGVDAEAWHAILIGPSRVELYVEPGSVNAMGPLFLGAERYLNEQTGAQIEVMYTEKRDANVKRRLLQGGSHVG